MWPKGSTELFVFGIQCALKCVDPKQGKRVNVGGVVALNRMDDIQIRES